MDLPDDEERGEIWKIHFEQRNFKTENFDLQKLIEDSKGFTGAEIESAIVSAMYEGFSDNERDINTVDIIKELNESVPIYITMKEKIEDLRDWASKRARNASKSKNVVIIEDSKNVKLEAKEDEEL